MTRNYGCCKRRTTQSLQKFRRVGSQYEWYSECFGANNFWYLAALDRGQGNIWEERQRKVPSTVEWDDGQDLFVCSGLREVFAILGGFSCDLQLCRLLFEVLKGKRILPINWRQHGLEMKFPGKNWKKKTRPLELRRLADILVGLSGILITLMFIPLLWLCNGIMNKGRLFYVQERVGKNGKAFKMYKFRTMRGISEPNGPKWAQKNDPRISGFGKFLRRSHLDELPQFYNILRGEMSLIGPRPERPVFVEELCRLSGLYMNRHVVRPGLTGWAQVMLPYGNSYPDSLEKLRFDLYYIRKGSFLLDLQILFRTAGAVLFLRGQ